MTSLEVIDLTALEWTLMRVRGTASYTYDRHRAGSTATRWLLFREPRNRHDVNAVAIHTVDGRRVGYVSAKRAALIAPLLDRLVGGAYLVGGVGATPETTTLHVDLPRVPVLREFAAAS